MLVDGQAEVEHILPYARTVDDSSANNGTAHRSRNREKGNHTPWEKWGGTPRWDAIAEQVAHLDKRKQWRFAPDAMERFEKDGGFIARQLTDTQYLARMARTYLSSLYPERTSDRLHGAGVTGVYVVPGRMTEIGRAHVWTPVTHANIVCS